MRWNASASLISSFETCPRKAYWSHWSLPKLAAKDMLSKGIRAGLMAPVASGEPGSSFGEVSGSEVLQQASDRGLDTNVKDVYSAVMHLAALSDILVSAVRKVDEKPWLIPEPVQNWTSEAMLSPDGLNLRRIVMVSHWNDDRHYAECKSWATLGEIVHYNLPMQLAILVIGQHRNGRYHGPWTQGFLHPQNHQLRFRKRSAGYKQAGNVFNDKWEKVAREDRSEISNEKWLQAMLTDDILRDVCFSVEVLVPPPQQCERIKHLASVKMERLRAMKEVPEAQLTGCHWPIECPFIKLCHSIPERKPSQKQGFVLLGAGGTPVESMENLAV